MPHVYLDWNATTPPHPDVLEAMRAAAAVAWANPASVHGPGRRARAFVEDAREAVAALVGLHPRDVVLTSGGTEANNLALALPFGDVLSGAASSPSDVEAGSDLALALPFGDVLSGAVSSPSDVDAGTDLALRLADASSSSPDAPRASAVGEGEGASLPRDGPAPRGEVTSAQRAGALSSSRGRAPSGSASTPTGRSRKRGATRAGDPRRGPEAPTSRGGRAALVVSRIEHPSIVRMAEHLEARGVLVAWVDPLPSGVVTAEAFAAAVGRLRAAGADVRLLVLQAVNHETGVVQPVAEVAAVARGCGALLHVDAVQAVGRLPASTWAGADMVSVAAHKIRGPKGIGALCTRPGLKVRPLLFGGAQERGLRPGTQDPVACAGFAVAAKRAHATGPARYAEVAAPHVSNVSWPGWRGEELCAALDLEGVAVSSGSACSAGTAEPSPVIRAMLGLPRASSAVRISLGEDTTPADIDRAVDAFRRVLERSARR